jgi:endonuclease/exonuclease/phosphatase (EEP) superfamily protein YafD
LFPLFPSPGLSWAVEFIRESDVDFVYLAAIVGLTLVAMALVRGCAALERRK